jgi:hypothetical protein
MITGVSLAADPAELKLAIVACHVVAPLALLYMGFATGTQPHIFAFGPLFEFLVNSILA